MKSTAVLRPTDAVLMQEVQAGQRSALAELYDRFALRAYRTAFAVCHDRDCAEDAVQDAFVSMWSSRATYEPARGSVLGWAMTIVRHRAIYLARRRSRRPARTGRLVLTRRLPAMMCPWTSPCAPKRRS